jgi:hypothetical protein
MATESTPAPKSAAPLPPKKRARRGFFFWLLLLAFIATAAWAISLYKENKALRDPESQARQIVAEMEELIVLPKDEVPGIFPIDKEQATEPFFQNAETGDLLVVYRTTQQAFIYSPSRHKLINAGVLIVNPGQETVPTTAAPEAEVEEEI